VRRGKRFLPMQGSLVVLAALSLSIFQPWIVVAVAPSFQSSTAHQFITRCRTASYSGIAEEALAQLKTQAQDMEREIEECETKARSARQAEEKDWLAAIDAKSRWDCADARRLFKKLLDQPTFYKKQAAAELKRLGDCGGAAAPIDDPDTALRYATDAYRSRDFVAARETAWRLVSRQDSVGKAARTLIQDLEQIETTNESLRQVDRSRRVGLNDDACSLLLRIQQSYPALPNISEVRSKLAACPTSQPTRIANVPTNERQAALEKRLLETRRFLSDGNLELAGDSLAAARGLSATDTSVLELSRDLETAKQARETLEAGISLRRLGKYPDAIERFKNAAALQISSGIGGRAHFELGVTLATQYFLSAGDSLKTAAQEEFRQSALNYSNPDFEYISPRIKELYDQALKGSKVG